LRIYSVTSCMTWNLRPEERGANLKLRFEAYS
jgi:hypothetical protein